MSRVLDRAESQPMCRSVEEGRARGGVGKAFPSVCLPVAERATEMEAR